MRTPNTISYQELTGIHAHHLSRTYSEPSPLTDLLQRPEWHSRAACRGQDLNWWFPTRGTPTPTTRAAKAICAGCEVKAECLDYALKSHPPEFGLWGGMGEKARKKARLLDPAYAYESRRHGTRSRYVGGCHCDLCRRANAQAVSKSRARSRKNRMKAKVA